MDSSNETPDSKSEKKRRLPRTRPIVLVETTALGPLTFRNPTVGDAIELERLDPNEELSADAFASNLLRVVGSRPRQGEDDGLAPLTARDVAALAPEEREAVIAGLLAGMSHLYTQTEKVVETGDDGQQIERLGETKVILPREEGESDEAFLLRAWRYYWKRTTAPFNDWTKKLGEATAGLSNSWKKAVIPDLFANKVASMGLSEQIAKMGMDPLSKAGLRLGDLGVMKPLGGSDFINVLKELGRENPDRWKLGTGSATDLLTNKSALDIAGISVRSDPSPPPALPRLKIPPNSIHETNELLEKMGTHIADMAQLASNTAEMQSSLNDAAVNILTLFSQGAEEAKAAAEKSDKTSRRALRVANITAVLTLLAVVAAIWGVLHQDGQTTVRDASAASEHAAEIKALDDDATATKKLAAAVSTPLPAKDRK